MIGWYPETINTSVVVTNCGRSGSLHREYQYVWDLDRELSPELIESQSIKNPGDQELLLELIDSPIDLRSIKNFLRSGALVRARWLPDRSKTSCDQKLLLELIDSIVDQQLSCDRETISDLIESLIDQNLLAIRSSYESTLTSWSTDTLVVIGSSY